MYDLYDVRTLITMESIFFSISEAFVIAKLLLGHFCSDSHVGSRWTPLKKKNQEVPLWPPLEKWNVCPSLHLVGIPTSCPAVGRDVRPLSEFLLIPTLVCPLTEKAGMNSLDQGIQCWWRWWYLIERNLQVSNGMISTSQEYVLNSNSNHSL
jgi:hypothetical protein